MLLGSDADPPLSFRTSSYEQRYAFCIPTRLNAQSFHQPASIHHQAGPWKTAVLTRLVHQSYSIPLYVRASRPFEPSFYCIRDRLDTQLSTE